ncbi:MAG: ATP-binding protein [Jaaginema sp. PMC 1080.18]|nr:ATP-binding protein [Jaaginema sp. PMC 1080.18]MEC4864706.1 ATP-binding protein [Jaaginema sp. PMC 1078.18]
MTPDQFLAFARVFPEPLLLISDAGEVLAANPATARILNCRRQELAGKQLPELVQEPAQKVLGYLKNCSRSRQFTIGSLTFLQAEDENVICRIEGAVVQPKSADNPAITLLRLENRAVANSEFILLNKKIDELAKEIQQRQQAEAKLQQRNQELQQTLTELKSTQSQLIQTEKMSSLGQLVAGVAHEINNPVSFIHGNLTHAGRYLHDLLNLVKLYQESNPQPTPEIQDCLEDIDFEFLVEDVDELLESMRVGTKRILEIVKSLRNFSRLDEAAVKEVDLHEGLESTLMILHHRCQGKHGTKPIEIIKQYGKIPQIDCHPSQINQVFMNILSNGIDAVTEKQDKLKTPGQICIRTEVQSSQYVVITIKDNGLGICESTRHKIFDPFFTTKKIGKGTGLGLSISHQIVTEMHQGKLECHSIPGEGTEFTIKLPLSLASHKSSEVSALISPMSQVS